MENSLANDIQTSSVEASDNWTPRIGMEFDTEEAAWDFWLQYGGKMGFNVRKQYANKNKEGIVTSRRFSCSKQGLRSADKRDHLTINARAETRTDCKVRIGIYLNKTTGKYEVQDFVSGHNHILHSPETTHLLSSQRKISEVQAIEIEIADDSGIRPRAAHEFIGAHVGGSTNLGYTHRDHKNHLRSKRQRELMYGEAGSLLKYFHLQTIDNPSFQYSIQLDCEEKITNIFWADAKMLIDYASFGDVVAFDTTFGTNKEHRPLGVFVGFNHFRETTVFGAALLYDETTDSFKWLFETFLATHGNKHPKTIFTDQDKAMGNAIEEVMPDVWHGLCTWHITTNATKHLLSYGLDVLQAFKACMYEYKEEEEFEVAFKALREKVIPLNDKPLNEEKGTWLDSIYDVKRKWAECYMENVFSLGMRSTQLSESFNKDLKDYLKCTMDIMRFFKQFDRVLRLKRQNETNNEFDSREKLPRIKMQRTPLLRQAGQLYTSNVFEAFQDEYEWSTAAYIKPPTEGQVSNEYRVVIDDPDNPKTILREYRVLGDPLTETVSCSCKMFDRLGILCAHALKVLDTMNIKLIPLKYILKRWTREAKIEIVQDISGRTIVEDPHLDATRRYKALCLKFLKVASRASNFVESSALLENGLNNMIVEVDKLLPSLGETVSSSNVSANEVPFILEKLVLKPKEGRKGGKRKKSFIENFRKVGTRGSQSDQTKQKKKKTPIVPNRDNAPPQMEGNQMVVEPHIMPLANNYQTTEVPCSSYTQLLMGQHIGSQDPRYCNLWNMTPFPSQAMNLHLVNQETHSHTNLNNLPNMNGQGL